MRGVYDVLPGETEKWQYIEKTARKVFDDYGFSEIKIPVMEKSELFTRSIGETTDIVEKEMYSFPDRKGEMLSLRPEGTASVVRSYVEHKMYAQGGLTKLFYMGPMFRYERPQKGRRRQFYQIGVEALGLSGAAIDAEVVSMLFTFFGQLGLEGLVLNINSIGCRDCRPVYREVLLDYLKDKVERLCDNCLNRYEKNPLRVIDCKSGGCRELTADAPSILDHLCKVCSDDFEQVKAYFNMIGLDYNVNSRMVRGLDYYTKTAFEITSENLGAQDAVAAGGRYDLLVEEIGGPPTPAVGFALGMERLSLLMVDEDLSLKRCPDLYIAVMGQEAHNIAFRLAHELRIHGIKTEFDHENKSLKAQMRKANNTGVNFVLILGEDEVKSGRAVLRDMSVHDQEEIAWEGILFEMKSRMGG
ncbi:MAG: histidine--tRNA ligase [Proteobacteria bacterium]|nr:histidine--tRNA ligase [Pseudomonadota bacterium]